MEDVPVGGAATRTNPDCRYTCVQPQIGDVRNQDLQQQHVERYLTRLRPRSIRLYQVPKLPSDGLDVRKIPQVLTRKLMFFFFVR